VDIILKLVQYVTVKSIDLRHVFFIVGNKLVNNKKNTYRSNAFHFIKFEKISFYTSVYSDHFQIWKST
jgi:hypothetical protein